MAWHLPAPSAQEYWISTMASQDGAAVRVVFSTNEAGLELPEDKCQLFVPLDTKRYGLSRILNSESMLNTSSPIPLDFLINGDFLRGSLGDYLAATGLNEKEACIELVYVRALVPPSFDRAFEHPEWIASVDLVSQTSHAVRWASEPSTSSPLSSKYPGKERILSGSFDGLLRVWNPEGECIATSPGPSEGGHRMAVEAARYLSPTRIASAGMDKSVRVWRYSEDDSAGGTPIGNFKPIMELRGHPDHVKTLEVHGAAGRLLTADDGGSVGFWSSSKESAPPAPQRNATVAAAAAAKRRKIITTTSFDVAQRGALHITKHHAGSARATFDCRDHTVAYSGGWVDYTVRTLDLTTSRAVSSVTLTANVTSLASLEGSMAPILAAGTTARRVVLVDPREGGSARTSVLILKGHTNWISALAQSPSSDYALASASYDGSVMVWDLRATGSARDNGASGEGGTEGRPVFVIDREAYREKKRPVAGEGIKVFDVKWDSTWGIVSGGEDKKVQVDRWLEA